MGATCIAYLGADESAKKCVDLFKNITICQLLFCICYFVFVGSKTLPLAIAIAKNRRSCLTLAPLNPD